VWDVSFFLSFFAVMKMSLKDVCVCVKVNDLYNGDNDLHLTPPPPPPPLAVTNSIKQQ
jgi:hypothetical protein